MDESPRFRWLEQRLPSPTERRLVVLTGSRQTGKTTLVKKRYAGLRYLNLDAIEIRETLRSVRSAAWAKEVGNAVLDEAQKEPSVFEKVKYAFDSHQVAFSVLLGSSRFLLMDRVRETLAGRAFVYELWPLMLSELVVEEGSSPSQPLLAQLLENRRRLSELLGPRTEFQLGDEIEARSSAVAHMLRWGGMPELLYLDDGQREDWLRSYQVTFLERDLADIAKLSDLIPFRALQRIAMLRSGQLLSFAELARDAGLSPSTARRYLEYLQLTYQVTLLPPYSRNLTSQVVKTPKLYWNDLGTLRQVTGHLDATTGALFETFIVAEVAKWVRTSGVATELNYYRTRSGLEVDLLAVRGESILAFEIKHRERVDSGDLRGLRALASALGPERWRGGVLVYTGSRLHCVDPQNDLWAVPVERLFF